MKTFIITLVIVIFSIASIDKTSSAEDIIFIINADNPETQLSHSQVIDYFMKRTRNWPNGTPVRFFDQTETSNSRKLFLRDYLKRSSRELEQYWIGQKLYTGNSAPNQVSTDSMMSILVSRFPGGIGYISSGTPIGKGVKKIEVIKDE